MKVTIIILNYNDYETTKKLIDQIKEYQQIDHIVIVDNSSTDNSYEALLALQNKKIEIIRTQKNLGYAYGNNQGIKYALQKYNSEIYIIANPDVSFQEIVVREIKNEFKEDDNIGIVTAKMQGSINAWKLPTWFDSVKSMFLFVNRFSKRYEKLKKQKNEVDVVSGSLFAIKREAFIEVGGFDERTFLYGEENILAYRLKEKGYKTIVLQNVEYEHHHSVSIKKEYKSKIKPFKMYVDSLKIYHQYYLKTNHFQNSIFYICYFFALIERYLYDCIMRIREIKL